MSIYDKFVADSLADDSCLLPAFNCGIVFVTRSMV